MRAWLAAALLVAGGLCWAEVAVPPAARITDLTGTLDRPRQQVLSERLAAFEKAKGSQIAVLIVPTTEPETIEQYAIRVAESWKLGRQGVDDGVLLVAAMRDRALRIEVGYGLEGAIPDAIAKRVIEEIILPRFREGDLPGGIEAGVDQLIALVNGEPLPESISETGDGESGALPVVFFLALALGQGLRRALGPAPAGLLVGALGFVLLWWLLGVAVFAAFMGLALFFMTLVGTSGGVRGAGGGHGGFGGRSGGGFSGGGGGFGGGGASGRW